MPTEEPTALATSLNSVGIVWLGIEIGWRRRPSDLRANTVMAERWENAFPRWNVESRQVELTDENATNIFLGDGVGRFQTQTGDGYQRIRQLMPEFLEALREGKRENLRAQVQVQYLRPCAQPFETLVSHLAGLTLKDSFLPSIGATLTDFAYMADTTVDGQWFQLHFGPVHAYEIRSRVFATNIRTPPPVAFFLHVTSRWKIVGATVDEVEGRLPRVLEIGTNTSNRLAL